jgi:hypothetical protein
VGACAAIPAASMPAASVVSIRFMCRVLPAAWFCRELRD